MPCQIVSEGLQNKIETDEGVSCGATAKAEPT